MPGAVWFLQHHPALPVSSPGPAPDGPGVLFLFFHLHFCRSHPDVGGFCRFPAIIWCRSRQRWAESS